VEDIGLELGPVLVGDGGGLADVPAGVLDARIPKVFPVGKEFIVTVDRVVTLRRVLVKTADRLWLEAVMILSIDIVLLKAAETGSPSTVTGDDIGLARVGRDGMLLADAEAGGPSPVNGDTVVAS
jgi:hypothetical protein